MFHKKVFVGEDEFGNKYHYKDGKTRSVEYGDSCDASTISPTWHLWLHYAVDEIPVKHVEWQKVRQQNPTGGKLAYNPRHNTRKLDYTPWQPK